MVHPDYQYTPRLVTAMASMVASGVYDVVLASRIIGGGALRGGMPVYKYVANRFLTAFQNAFLGAKLSEYHTGFRVFLDETFLTSLPCRELRRFCVRQSYHRPESDVRLSDWRDFLSNQLLRRGLLHQLSPGVSDMDLEFWLPRRCSHFTKLDW